MNTGETIVWCVGIICGTILVGLLTIAVTYGYAARKEASSRKE